jgi:NDP-sugar pyrophosphorylase family protein
MHIFRVEIGEKCVLSGSAVEDRCHVGAASHVTGSILMRGCRIGANCSLTDCIIGRLFVKAGVSCVCCQSRDQGMSRDRDMSV